MKELSEVLKHHGVQGMKWGVRRDASSRRRQRTYNKGMRLIDRVRLKNMSSAEARKKYLDDKDKKWIEKAGDDKNIRKVTKQVNKEFKRVNGVLKDEFGGKGVKGALERSVMPSTSVQYNRSLKSAYDEILLDKSFSVYKMSPTRTREVKLTPNPDGTMKATIVERSNPKLNKQRSSINHAESDDSTSVLDGMPFIIIPDDDGFADRVVSPFEDDEEDTIQHYGVKGMKWGTTRSSSQLKSEATSTGAGGGSEDAEEKLDKLGDDIDALKSKVGNNPLDMLKYILFGKTTKTSKKSGSSKTKGKGSEVLDSLGKSIKDLRSKVGKGPLDMLNYVIFGKRKVKHSGLNEEIVPDQYVQTGLSIVEGLIRDEKLNSSLQHTGVKGMKWGIRRDYTQRGGADGKLDAKDKPIRTAIGKHLKSLKREREWKSVLREMDSMSTKDITELTKRVSLENALKHLSRSKVGTKSDKQDYLRRERMDNQELSRKVTRLKAKESLHNAVSSASKEQREFGQKAVQIGGSLGIKYVLKKSEGKSIGFKDVFDTVKSPKASADKEMDNLKKAAWKKLKAQNGGS